MSCNSSAFYLPAFLVATFTSVHCRTTIVISANSFRESTLHAFKQIFLCGAKWHPYRRYILKSQSHVGQKQYLQKVRLLCADDLKHHTR